MQAAHTHMLQDDAGALVHRDDRVIADLMARGLDGNEGTRHHRTRYGDRGRNR